MRITNCILLTLLDGEPHKVREIYPYVARRIDPSKAAHTYNLLLNGNRKKREAKTGRPTEVRKVLPLEQQVVKGSWHIFNASLWHLRKEGQVGVSDESSVADRTVWLTPTGQARLNESASNNSRVHWLWKELKRWYVRGLVKISLRGLPEEGGANPDTDQKNEEEVVPSTAAAAELIR